MRNALVAGDTESTLGALRLLGARIERGRDFRFTPSEWHPPAHAVDCGNSGTTLRLLTAAVARLQVPVVLQGDASLRARPNQPLLDALHGLGVNVESNAGSAPLRVRGPLRSGTASLPAGSSSQFATALLLSLPMLEGDSRLLLAHPIASAPYLEVTQSLARTAGLTWETRSTQDQTHYEIPGGQIPRAHNLAVGGDWSNASFWLVAAAITGGDVTVTNLDPDSAQGDRAIVQLLQSFGSDALLTTDGVRALGGAALRSPAFIDVSQCPDLFPILCVMAACSTGTTTLVGAKALRGKESDRIAAMARALQTMGIRVHEGPDQLRIEGGTLRGGRLESLGDHRVHMALAVAALVASGPTTIDSPGCVAVSYPDFHFELARLTGAP